MAKTPQSVLVHKHLGAENGIFMKDSGIGGNQHTHQRLQQRGGKEQGCN